MLTPSEVGLYLAKKRFILKPFSDYTGGIYHMIFFSHVSTPPKRDVFPNMEILA